ncbi:ribosome biogenesis GTPase A [Thermosyntropha lipolytica DSM 11003]|uniref:Ribosome biogenesis GTPase A n=1 Tax=Thermosyntropha lipolytica DSM 11003 TaxID=1123382 RepID=A0A1M5QNA8_9FIRM|nr:ribosome biogenesis GTPase YlqF [Thermosyntropha lipolytica]SHH15289.1 ribosome biogenesis GTPase A [Thermosyntropha lipolytica DSM 11003]
MVINWYPGHMVKARREIQNSLKLVDIVIILLDARAPFSCRNRDLERMVGQKPLIMVLNKMDLADAGCTERYIEELAREGLQAVAVDAITGKGMSQVLKAIGQTYKPLADKMLAKGRRVRPARVMVAGVPNVGKSTFLNCLVGKKVAKTGAKPGVTRGKQWVRVREDIELMDTPGLMWPKIESEEQGLKLALLEVIGENAYHEDQVALYLVKILREKRPEVLKEKFRLADIEGTDEEILQAVGRKRGYLIKGGEVDFYKTCHMLLHDFRKGSLGRISLD